MQKTLSPSINKYIIWKINHRQRMTMICNARVTTIFCTKKFRISKHCKEIKRWAQDTWRMGTTTIHAVNIYVNDLQDMKHFVSIYETIQKSRPKNDMRIWTASLIFTSRLSYRSKMIRCHQSFLPRLPRKPRKICLRKSGCLFQ